MPSFRRHMDMSTALKQILAEGNELPAEIHDELRRNLLALEQSAIVSPDRFRVFRLSILEFTEPWKVAELIDDIRFADDDGVMLAARMEEVVSPLYVNIQIPATYVTCKLSSLTLRKCTVANYGDSARNDWWDVFVDTIFNHIAWLQRGIETQRESERTDESVLHEWKELRAEARKNALEWPVGIAQYPIPLHRQGKQLSGASLRHLLLPLRRGSRSLGL